MIRKGLIYVVILVGVPTTGAQRPEQPKVAAQHAPLIAELQNEPAAMRSFQLNQRGEVVALAVCSHLSPEDVAAIRNLNSLTSLTIGGNLPISRTRSPTEEEIAAEARRHRDFSFALPGLSSLTCVKQLRLRHVPTAEELEAVFEWTQLESLTGDIPPEHHGGIARLTNLKHLALLGTPKQPCTAEFLGPLTALESLTLPTGFGDDTFKHLADKQRLTKIEGKSLSGEALVEYLMDKRGMDFNQALRGARYWFRTNERGTITYLHFAYTDRFDRLYSQKILDRLSDVREMSFTHIGPRKDQVIQAIRDRPLESLNMTNVQLDASVMAEFCKLETLKQLRVAFSATEIELPKISGLPHLEVLALGGINDYKTHITQIADLPRLVELRVYGANIDRQHIEQLQELPSLKSLTLGGATFSRAAFDALASLTHLESLNLSKSNLDDAQLARLSKLKHLKQIDTSGTQVTVDARARFLGEHLKMGPMKILQDAGVRCQRENSRRINYIHFKKKCGGELIRAAAKFPEVSRLKFMMTAIDPGSLASIGMLSRVEEVEFIYCKTLDDEMIEHLAEMPALRKLKIVNSGLSDDSIGALLKLTNLESLQLRGKSISPEVVAQIREQLPKIDTRDD